MRSCTREKHVRVILQFSFGKCGERKPNNCLSSQVTPTDQAGFIHLAAPSGKGSKKRTVRIIAGWCQASYAHLDEYNRLLLLGSSVCPSALLCLLLFLRRRE
ncbi:hypothetical protein ACLOJK_005695 [Asimina triloba]